MLSELPNVEFLGRRDYKTLAGYCKAFDVAILRFSVNDSLAANGSRCTNLATSLPVVSTPLPEIRKLEALLRTAAELPEEFVARIEGVLNEGRGGARHLQYRS